MLQWFVEEGQSIDDFDKVSSKLLLAFMRFVLIFI